MNSQDQADAVAQAIRAMGAAFNSEVLQATYELFRPLQERAPKNGIKRHNDIAYGDDPRHVLDVFAPAGEGLLKGTAPVVVFVHGGGFIGGERSPLPGLINDNVATFFARHGCIAVNASYRLAPDHTFPSGAQDVGRIVTWLRENIASFGGDPQSIVLFGHSAGAAHVAAWTFVERVHGSAGPRIAAAILMSGVYSVQHQQFHTGNASPNQQAYYGRDAAAWEGMATLGKVKRGHPPVFIGLGEFDPYPFAWPSLALAGELVRCDQVAPAVHVVAGHNHISTVAMINSEVDTLGPELLRFVLEKTALT